MEDRFRRACTSLSPVRSQNPGCRTTAGAAQNVLAFGALRIDPARRDAERDGDRIALTTLEFDLLWFLASHPRLVFSRETLMERVWGYQAAFDTGTVTVHMRRLREKIELDPTHPRHLLTVWGVGYRFDP